MINLDNACYKFFTYANSSSLKYHEKKEEFKKSCGFFRPLSVQSCIDLLNKKIKKEKKKDCESNLYLLIPAIKALSEKIDSSKDSLKRGYDILDNTKVNFTQRSKRLNKLAKISSSLANLSKTVKEKTTIGLEVNGLYL